MAKKLPKRRSKKPPHLTDAGLKKIVPMFVESANNIADHKCGSCLFRVGKDQCAIMKGLISFRDGTCMFWAKGKAMPQVNLIRMTKLGAGYVESSGKINCGTCVYFDNGVCKLWNGSVHKGDCCMAWKKD